MNLECEKAKAIENFLSCICYREWEPQCIPTLITKTTTEINPKICKSGSTGIVLYFPDGTSRKIPSYSDCIEQNEISIREWITAHINEVLQVPKALIFSKKGKS